MDNTRQRRISILMLPWLAHGHISPFLELAKNLTSRNFQIYFCSTPVILTSIKPKLSKNYSLSIQLVEIHLPLLPDLPPCYHTTKGLPPHLLTTLKRAFDIASPRFSDILKTLNPDLLIYDFNQPWAPALASSQNIPAVNFICAGATTASFFLHSIKNPGDEFPFPEVFLHDYIKKTFTDMLETCSSSNHHLKDKDRLLKSLERSSNIILVKTFGEIEGKYFDYLSSLIEKKIVPVGPLVQNPFNEDDQKSEIIDWLDTKTKERPSVVFVSFGSEYFLSKEEMEEVAHGLELSGVDFIWVVRFPMGEKIELEEALPEGFLGRIGERGMVVEDWAPQGKILRHSSIGGFVSHCGWSSVMESILFGVPIIAMPMQFDQPLNARVVEEVGVGVEVKRDGDGKLRREDVAEVIKEVTVERTGESVRRKAREMSDIIRKRGAEEIDGVVDELIQLCL